MSTITPDDAFIRSITGVLGLPDKPGVVSSAVAVVMTAIAHNLLTCVQNAPTVVLKWHKTWKDDRKWGTMSNQSTTNEASSLVRVLLYILRLIKRVYGVQWCVRWLTDLLGFTKPDASKVQLIVPQMCGMEYGAKQNLVFNDLMW